jgi:2-keto-4-pentenoate hydratase/2-oxohepta-3-ene-1,7-dioic acid hydratase in catechol pathway
MGGILMRIVRFKDAEGQIQLGLDQPDDPNKAQLLAGQMFQGLEPTGQTVDIHKRLAPIAPTNIFCIGLNYLQHAKETGAELPDYPIVFMKPTSALNHPGAPIRLPKKVMQGPETDYECELAVIVGKEARDVSEADALSYVFGYTAANDVSARRWQKQGGGGQWIRGKGFDTFCPLGPVLVTADEIPDPQTLEISTTINGQELQHSNTRDMIFSVAQLIAYLSTDTTLLPGTVILTGTPSGVGFVREPKVLLTDGDVVTVDLEKVGKLTNPVING